VNLTKSLCNLCRKLFRFLACPSLGPLHPESFEVVTKALRVAQAVMNDIATSLTLIKHISFSALRL
jgi:hypothetical protein